MDGQSAGCGKIRDYVIDQLATGRYMETDFVYRNSMPHILECEACKSAYDAAVSKKKGG